MAVPTLLQSILAWVRKGYPEGVPPQDYIPLLALMQRRLTDDELAELAHQLVHASDENEASAMIAEAIERVTREPASADGVERVRERLIEVGWDPAGEAVPTP
jgi:Protein of unknown function (DUF3349)